MQIENKTQVALAASKLLEAPSPTQDQKQTTGVKSTRSDMPDVVAFSQRAKVVLDEIRRLAAEEAATRRGQTVGSDAATVSLRLDTTGPARQDGAVKGGASVNLQDTGTGSGRIVNLDVSTGDGDDTVSISAAGRSAANALVLTRGGNDAVTLQGMMGVITDGGHGDDVIRGKGAEGTFNGGAGNDTFELENVSGQISGGAGDDRINLSWDGTAAAAERHTAKLQGSDGSSREVVVRQNVAHVAFRRGGGHDVVTTAVAPGTNAPGAADVLMAGLSASEVEAKRDGKDLVLRVKDTGDSLTLRDYDPGAWKLISFRDGEKSLADFIKNS